MDRSIRSLHQHWMESLENFSPLCLVKNWKMNTRPWPTSKRKSLLLVRKKICSCQCPDFMIQNYMPICFEIYRCQSSDQERFRKDKKDYYDYDGGDCYPCYCQYHSKNCFQHQQTPILWLNKQKFHEWKPEWIFQYFTYFNFRILIKCDKYTVIIKSYFTNF